MKISSLLLGLLTIILLVSYLDSQEYMTENESNYFNYTDEIATSSSVTHSNVPTFSSLEYILEDTKEKEDYLIEIYREYEIHRDENDVIVKREPTDNYNYLRYKKE